MFLQRNLRTCSKEVKINAYNIYVKPILMYASCVWNPVGTSNQNLHIQIEKVQRKAGCFVFAYWSWQSSPTLMVQKLKWRSLESQRKINSLMMLHKIVYESIAIPMSMLPKCDGIKFQRVYERVNAFSNSFVPTTVAWWNDLPTEILNIIEPSLFRNEISQIFN